MFLCPNCRTALDRQQSTTGVYWACKRCGGRAVGIGLLRRTIGQKIVTEAWARSGVAPESSGRPCPICTRHMVEITLTVAEKPLALDLCRRCEFMWFDPTEYESIPAPPPKPHVLGEIDESTLPQEARTALALAKVDAIREAADDYTPDEDWKTIPAIFGMPVEMDSTGYKRVPWATYLLTALIAAISIATFFDLQPAVANYGLIPAQPWRHHGVTFVTSFFLHAGAYHLASNLYFLLIFGRAVEDFVGRPRWLLLLAFAAMTGDFLHVLIDPHRTIPSIGASGGISGLIAFYALKFPHARLGFLFYLHWIRIPAWSALLAWIALQVLGTYRQVTGASDVSSLAHLGGLAAGIICWLTWRNLDQKPAAVNPLLVKVIR